MSFKLILIITILIGEVSYIYAGNFSHSELNTLLNDYTGSGLVNYSKIKNNDSLLTGYLYKLNNVSEAEYSTWGKWSKMAFWINAYNAITIYGIIMNYPIKYGSLLSRVRFPRNSIRQIKDFWDTDFNDIFGKKITLNQIEHEILRREFGDPRIHFSIVCASIGCPELNNSVYRGDSLDWQLDNDVRRFINDSNKVRLDTLRNVIYLSSIFKWYSDDFPESENHEWLKGYNKDERRILGFIIRYMAGNPRNYTTQKTPKIKYLDYDWSLNEIRE
ncbi:MAG: DUF547 domain-containing protein [candidate division Zixibacteria bacterium]|nr:DUF547 domain-containing protein [candidate division Zixibacteria bacterium]